MIISQSWYLISNVFFSSCWIQFDFCYAFTKLLAMKVNIFMRFSLWHSSDSHFIWMCLLSLWLAVWIYITYRCNSISWDLILQWITCYARIFWGNMWINCRKDKLISLVTIEWMPKCIRKHMMSQHFTLRHGI